MEPKFIGVEGNVVMNVVSNNLTVNQVASLMECVDEAAGGSRLGDSLVLDAKKVGGLYIFKVISRRSDKGVFELSTYSITTQFNRALVIFKSQLIKRHLSSMA